MILITLCLDEELDALIAQKAEAGERLTNFELKAGFLRQEGRTYYCTQCKYTTPSEKLYRFRAHVEGKHG